MRTRPTARRSLRRSPRTLGAAMALGLTLALGAALAACAPAGPQVLRTPNGMLAEGSILPEIRGDVTDGTVLTNATLHGKTVLLNLWFVG